jgi:hypothetical protein
MLAAQNPLLSQLGKCLNLIGSEFRSATARKKVFLGGSSLGQFRLHSDIPQPPGTDFQVLLRKQSMPLWIVMNDCLDGEVQSTPLPQGNVAF